MLYPAELRAQPISRTLEPVTAVRDIPWGRLYARLRVRGKPAWKSLQTEIRGITRIACMEWADRARKDMSATAMRVYGHLRDSH